ncbi:MAG: GNAT family N-acetyltransferase [Lachnospiraceae bacterium]|nr:GNAT family N-acetyltransferase [Lachnospiraceae bacterium]
MKIRRAGHQDMQAVNKLLSEVLEIHAEIRPDIFISGTKKYTDEELDAIFIHPDTPVFVAVDEADQVQGYCFCEIQEKKGLNNIRDMKTLYIDDLCVEESARGKHVGRELYDYVIAYARQLGCHNVTLHVWEGNERARAFYDRMGFGIQKTLMEKIL